MGAVIGAVHQVLVGPFEVEGDHHGLAQAPIGELVAPGVEQPALRARGALVGNDLALDAAVAKRREVVARRPDPRGELLAEQIIAADEGFQADLAVAVVFVAQQVEIILSARDGKIFAPPVLDPLEFDVAPLLEARHAVGTRAERRLERGLVERSRAVVFFREDRHRRGQRRRIEPTGRREPQGDGLLVLGHDFGELAQHRGIGRMPLGLQRGQREDDVGRGDVGAVVKPDPGAQAKAVEQPVGRNRQVLRCQRDTPRPARRSARVISDAKVRFMSFATSPLTM